MITVTAARAQTTGTVTVRIDVDATGNTATSLGIHDDCRSIAPGDTVDIDITAKAIPPWEDLNGNGKVDFDDRGGLRGFQYQLDYDPNVLNVIAVENQLMIAANAVTPIDLSYPLPNSTGEYIVGFADFGDAPAEHGDGVLSRLTVRAVGSGQTELRIQLVKVLDGANQPLPLKIIQPSAVSVGQPCATPPQDSPEPPGANGGQTEPGGDGGTGPRGGGGEDGETGSGDAGDAPGTGADSPGPDSDTSPAPRDSTATPRSGTARTEDDESSGGPGGLGWLVIGLAVPAGLAAAGAGGWLAWKRLRVR